MAELSSIIREAAARYGVSPEMMLRIAQLESGMNPNAANPNSSARGVYQFMTGPGGSWHEYGKGANPLDPNANVDAGMRYTLDNMQHLRSKLGREPTPAETYLAHQQGRAGATALLAAPDKPAAEVLSAFHSPAVARQAVALNAGNPDAPARDFIKQWQAKYEGAALPNHAAGDVASSIAPATDVTNPAALTPSSQNNLGSLFSDLLPAKEAPPPPPKKKRPVINIGDLGQPVKLSV